MPITPYSGREWNAEAEKARRLEWAEEEETNGHFLSREEWDYVRMTGNFTDDVNYRYYEDENYVVARRPLLR